MADPKKLTKVPLGATGNTVAENLARLMETLNIKPTELSKRLEEVGRRIPVLGVRSILSKERRVDVDDLFGLCAALGVCPTALLMPPADSDESTVEMTGVGTVPARDAYYWLMGQPLPGTPNYWMSLVLSTPQYEVDSWPTEGPYLSAQIKKRLDPYRIVDGDGQ